MPNDSLPTPRLELKQERFEQLEVRFADEIIATLKLSGFDNGKLSYQVELQGIDEDQWEKLCDTPTFTSDATFIDVPTKAVIPTQSIALIYSSPGWVIVYLRNPTNSVWGTCVEILKWFLTQIT